MLHSTCAPKYLIVYLLVNQEHRQAFQPLFIKSNTCQRLKINIPMYVTVVSLRMMEMAYAFEYSWLAEETTNIKNCFQNLLVDTAVPVKRTFIKFRILKFVTKKSQIGARAQSKHLWVL